jgi:hypothetical protein
MLQKYIGGDDEYQLIADMFRIYISLHGIYNIDSTKQLAVVAVIVW